MSFLDRAKQAAAQAAEGAKAAADQARQTVSDPATAEKAKMALSRAKRGVSTAIDRIDPGVLADVIIKATALQEKANAGLKAKGSPYRISEVSIGAAIPPSITFAIARIDDPAHLRHLGVPELDTSGRVVRIHEKPDDPPSSYVVTGIYFYDEHVFDVIPTLQPSGRGELEITDVNNSYVERRSMQYDVLDGFWGDAGESIDAYYEVNDFVRVHGANKG